MKCQHCGNNEAEYQYTVTIGNHQIDRYLCAACAKELGYESKDTGLSFDQLFSDFLSAKTQNKELETTISPCIPDWS